jgi:glycosyltransferase involved in cell wall biosynthesis
MKNKKAIIVTNSGFTSRYLKDRYHAILIPPRDPNQLASSVIQLSKDTNLRSFIGENAYRFFQEHLSLQKISEEILNLIEEVFNSKANTNR